MADAVTITVDNRGALVKLDRVPVVLRDEFRRVIPDLTRQLGRLVDSNLAAGLKSRTTLTTNVKMHESVREIYGEVSVTSPSAKGLLPKYLEEGTDPHLIEGNPILSFFWDKLGKQVYFHSVNHPGFKGLHYMQNAFDQMQNEIVDKLQVAAHNATAGLK